jgi:hypothetical protein
MRSRPLLLIALLVLAGCTPSIGDKCVLSTDCSIRGDRLCDTSQPDGYCTIFNCRGNLCPDEAACVLFNAAVQGCGYSDRAPSRTGRTFCMAQCHSNSDCRDRYICAYPRQGPWNAVILDDDQTQKVCIVPPETGQLGVGGPNVVDAAVCQSPSVPNASLADGGVDAAADAGAPDAGTDAADASSDAAGD